MNKDLQIIIVAFFIISIAIVGNVYTEKSTKWNEYVKWSEIYITPAEERMDSNEYIYLIDGPGGQEKLIYNAVDSTVKGNFIQIENTLFFSDKSLTLIDVNERYLKALMVPSTVRKNTNSLFSFYTELDEEFQYSVYSDGDKIAFNPVSVSDQKVVFGTAFNTTGEHVVHVDISTAKDTYRLEWVVNVID